MKHEIERSEMVPCERDDCEFWDNALDGSCSGCIGGEPAIASCPKYEPEECMDDSQRYAMGAM